MQKSYEVVVKGIAPLMLSNVQYSDPLGEAANRKSISLIRKENLKQTMSIEQFALLIGSTLDTGRKKELV